MTTTHSDRGRLASLNHAATTEIFSEPWQINPQAGKLVLWVKDSRGGTLNVYRSATLGDNAAGDRFDTQTIPAAELTAVAYNFPIPLGYVGFVPADGTRGNGYIDLDSGV